MSNRRNHGADAPFVLPQKGGCYESTEAGLKLMGTQGQAEEDRQRAETHDRLAEFERQEAVDASGLLVSEDGRRWIELPDGAVEEALRSALNGDFRKSDSAKD